MKATGLLLISLLLGLALGWLASGAFRPSEDSARNRKSPPRQLGNWDRSHVPEDVRAKTEAVMLAGSAENRMRAMIELANGVPLSDIEKWLDEGRFDTTDGWIDRVCHQILLDRLFGADPKRCMRRLLRRSAPHEIFATSRYMEQWTGSDPAGAVGFLLTLPSHQQRQLGSSTLLQLAKTDPSRALDLISTFSRNPELTGQFNHSLRLLVKTQSERLLEESESWPQAGREAILQEVGALRMAENFEAGLDWIVKQESGKQLFSKLCNSDGSLAPRILANADLLPEGWLEHAASSSMYYLVRGAHLAWLQADAETLGMTQGRLERVKKYAATSYG